MGVQSCLSLEIEYLDVTCERDEVAPRGLGFVRIQWADNSAREKPIRWYESSTINTRPMTERAHRSAMLFLAGSAPEIEWFFGCIAFMVCSKDS